MELYLHPSTYFHDIHGKTLIFLPFYVPARMGKSTKGRWTSYVKTKVRNRQLHNIILKIEGIYSAKRWYPHSRQRCHTTQDPHFVYMVLVFNHRMPPSPRHCETLRNMLVLMVAGVTNSSTSQTPATKPPSLPQAV